jgi:hypothetical protein
MKNNYEKKRKVGQAWWLMTVIPAKQEAEIRKIIVQCQVGQKVSQSPSQPIAGCGGISLSSQLHGKHK